MGVMSPPQPGVSYRNVLVQQPSIGAPQLMQGQGMGTGSTLGNVTEVMGALSFSNANEASIEGAAKA